MCHLEKAFEHYCGSFLSRIILCTNDISVASILSNIIFAWIQPVCVGCETEFFVGRALDTFDPIDGKDYLITTVDFAGMLKRHC